MRNRRFSISVILVLAALLGGLLFLFITITTPAKISGSNPSVLGMKFKANIFGASMKPEDLLRKPTEVAISPNGDLYITDTGNDRIAVFDKNRNFLRFLPTKIRKPLSIGIASNGRIYVTSKLDNKVVILSPQGTIVSEASIRQPLFLTVKGSRVYVATGGSVTVLDLDGKALSHWGSFGRNPGEFAFPNGITVGSDDGIYVSDLNNMRIQALTSNGLVRWIIGTPPKEAFSEKGRLFGAPAGITQDDKGLLYVVDAFHNSIHVIDPKGKGEHLYELGGTLGAGELQFDHPAGITYGGGRTFYVADKFNDRVQVIDIILPGEGGFTEIARTVPWYVWPCAGLLLILLVIAGVNALWRRRRRKVASEPTEGSDEEDVSGSE